MGLFIGQTDGVNNFDVGQVEVDIMQIGLLDIGVGFTENPTTNIEGVTCVQVTYAQTEFGNTANRLNDLVNNVTYVSPPNIIVFAVDDSFVLDDGTTTLPLKGNGIALPAGDSLSPFANNVCAFYDKTLCGGQGVWVDKEGGGTVCNTPEVVLYHELSHCFHFVTGTTAPTSADEERNAEIDENDMRDVRGLDHRDVDSHNGDCGGADTCFGTNGNCCIIASLATGSAHSDSVRRFRQFREKILRRTEVGDAFFKEFHYYYYSFSPEVCRLMGHQPNLAPEIREKFVEPLLAAIELLIFYAENKGNGLADFLRQQSEQKELQGLYRTEFLEELSTFLGLVKNLNQTSMVDFLSLQNEKITGFTDLLIYINEQTLANEYVRWALVDVLDIWVTSAMLLKSDKSRKEIESEIYRLLSDWIAHLPVTPVWEDFSRLQTELELESLGRFIFDPEAKRVFARRLIEIYPKYSTTIHRWCDN
jgi:hypothetical protein